MIKKKRKKYGECVEKHEIGFLGSAFMQASANRPRSHFFLSGYIWRVERGREEGREVVRTKVLMSLEFGQASIDNSLPPSLAQQRGHVHMTPTKLLGF